MQPPLILMFLEFDIVTVSAFQPGDPGSIHSRGNGDISFFTKAWAPGSAHEILELIKSSESSDNHHDIKNLNTGLVKS